MGVEEGSAVKLSLRGACPVRSDDGIVGAVSAGINLSSNHAFVDQIKKDVDAECTIFHNDTRVTTTIMKDGQRAIGTKMDNPAVIDTVLTKGRTFHNVNKIMGKYYDTIYMPLVNPEGKSVGMLFLGKDRDQVTRAYIGIIVSLLIAGLVIGTLMTISAIMMTRSLVRPIRSMSDTIRAVSEGDLTRRIVIESGDEIAQIGKDFNKSIDNLHKVISNVAENSAGVSGAATLLNSTAMEMETVIGQAVMQTDSVATASEEMTTTSSEIARNCAGAAKSSEDANFSATRGGEIVEQTVLVMNTINERVKESSGIIRDLGSASEKIGQVTELINEIADQTNLLALNAAIEAARAGDHGRGFAVVADEVRKLAERTIQATAEIGNNITKMQDETRKAITSMDKGVHEVNQGAEEASKSGDALRDILAQVNNVSHEINQIAAASEQQTSTTTEITSNIQQIAFGIQEAAKRIQDNAGMASQLAGLSDDLQKSVAAFRL